MRKYVALGALLLAAIALSWGGPPWRGGNWNTQTWTPPWMTCSQPPCWNTQTTTVPIPQRPMGHPMPQKAPMNNPRGPVCIECHGSVPQANYTMASGTEVIKGYAIISRYSWNNVTHIVIVLTNQTVNGKRVIAHVVLPPYCYAPKVPSNVTYTVSVMREGVSDNFYWVWGRAVNCG